VPLEKVTYVCPPVWLRKLIGRVPARAVVFCLIAIRYRANVLGGLHLLLNGLIALAAARVLGARAVYYCVGGWAELLDGGVHTESRLFNLVSQPRPSLERALLRAVRQMDLIVTMGTGARAFFRQAGVTAPIEVMPGGIDPARFCGAAREPQYDLITVARVVPIKRMDILLQVVRGVAQALPQVKAVIVGDGSNRPGCSC
jgi:glycosyltransferase involved in cell wall biosynthesis